METKSHLFRKSFGVEMRTFYAGLRSETDIRWLGWCLTEGRRGKEHEERGRGIVMCRDRSHDRPGQGRAPCRVPKRAAHHNVYTRVCLNASSFLFAFLPACLPATVRVRVTHGIRAP